MKTTGSVTNNLMAMGNSVIPVVDMGVTILAWTDRYAATIVYVSKNGRRVKVKRDIVRQVDKNGSSETQKYISLPNRNSPEILFSLRKDGTWKNTNSGNYLLIGKRAEYYDHNF